MSFSGMLSFLKSVLLHPRTMGAVLPSSASLAAQIAKKINLDKDGYVLELGPGTGVITDAILKAGLPPEKLILIEVSEIFSHTLKKRFPDCIVITGNAKQLRSLIRDKKIHTIISSIPLRSLPKKEVEKILAAISDALPPHSHFIQFTYSLLQDAGISPKNAVLIDNKIVWGNIPPAKIQLFEML